MNILIALDSLLLVVVLIICIGSIFKHIAYKRDVLTYHKRFSDAHIDALKLLKLMPTLFTVNEKPPSTPKSIMVTNLGIIVTLALILVVGAATTVAFLCGSGYSPLFFIVVAFVAASAIVITESINVCVLRHYRPSIEGVESITSAKCLLDDYFDIGALISEQWGSIKLFISDTKIVPAVKMHLFVFKDSYTTLEDYTTMYSTSALYTFKLNTNTDVYVGIDIGYIPSLNINRIDVLLKPLVVTTVVDCLLQRLTKHLRTQAKIDVIHETGPYARDYMQLGMDKELKAQELISIAKY